MNVPFLEGTEKDRGIPKTVSHKEPNVEGRDGDNSVPREGNTQRHRKRVFLWSGQPIVLVGWAHTGVELINIHVTGVNVYSIVRLYDP